jgi:tRNA-splicing ligase RtcB
MRVPGVIFGSERLLAAMDEKVREQVSNVASLPGIVRASYAMPDAHWGYGFSIGGVAAFDPNEGGVVSAGGVGFDISCGVRMLRTELPGEAIENTKEALANDLFAAIPAGVGSAGAIRLDPKQLDAMLAGGARWAVAESWGTPEDLDRIEENGLLRGARPDCVSEEAKRRQRDQVGTLGSGNHYLEVQRVTDIYDENAAEVFGLRRGEVVVSIHCGSRGLGHQIGTDYLAVMAAKAQEWGIRLPERDLACAPIRSEIGERYLGAMRAGMNSAMANRQVLTALTRQVFANYFAGARLPLLYDVSHNTCKEETHEVDGRERQLFVHRKGATRAFGPGHPDIPEAFRGVGQPVIVGGSMGTCSFVLAGSTAKASLSLHSACHGAGRAVGRNEAMRRWNGKAVVKELAQKGILIRSPSMRGVAEEAPLAYKDVMEVCEATERAGLARRVVRLEPMICVKG